MQVEPEAKKKGRKKERKRRGVKKRRRVRVSDCLDWSGKMGNDINSSVALAFVTFCESPPSNCFSSH
jgi:hypothetical protein